MTKRPWTQDDTDTVRRMASAGYSDAEIGRHLGRGRDIVGRKRRALSIGAGMSGALVAMMARINARRLSLTFARHS